MFFVLFNTQKGKSGITIKKIISWAQDKTMLFVTILLLESNISLGDQTVEGIVKRMELEGIKVKLFQFVSTLKTSVDDVIQYIDCNVGFPDEYPAMPMIVALNNDKQMAKVLEILNHIDRRHEKWPNLVYGIVWDRFVYSQLYT